jgi:TonB family protein
VPGERATGVAAAAADSAGSTSQTKAQIAMPAPAAKREGQLIRMTPAAAGDMPAPTGVPQRIRVSSAVTQGLLVKEVQPIYPEEAKVARAQGSVIMAALIGKDGTVQNLRIVNSDSPLLNQAALDAVKQWKYKPYVLNGTPVEVDTNVTVNFTLTVR